MAEMVRRRRAAELNGHELVTLYQTRATLVALLSICRGCFDGSLLVYLQGERGSYNLYTARIWLQPQDWDVLDGELAGALSILEDSNGRE